MFDRAKVLTCSTEQGSSFKVNCYEPKGSKMGSMARTGFPGTWTNEEETADNTLRACLIGMIAACHAHDLQ